MTFASFALSPQIVRAVQERKYTTPTPIQSAVSPGVLSGRDVWAWAHTGSGKTAAIALPLLQRHAEASQKSQCVNDVLGIHRKLCVRYYSVLHVHLHAHRRFP
jgi:superfamily II DNA/RNA helicase